MKSGGMIGIAFILLWIETWILLQLSETIPNSALWTEIIIAFLVGWWMIRRDGLSLWTFFESELHNRRLPSEELLDGVLGLISGVLWVIPGIVTDGLGLALMIPTVRYAVAVWMRQRLKIWWKFDAS